MQLYEVTLACPETVLTRVATLILCRSKRLLPNEHLLFSVAAWSGECPSGSIMSALSGRHEFRIFRGAEGAEARGDGRLAGWAFVPKEAQYLSHMPVCRMGAVRDMVESAVSPRSWHRRRSCVKRQHVFRSQEFGVKGVKVSIRSAGSLSEKILALKDGCQSVPGILIK
ncbi:hypothetical protein IF1G_10345 [Cordyceps javanica]|uniref:Uncharacterized protein n=1 Tax=Cordyceps javanica TaxID=43265 RepID=A0A545UNS5_9HYPO|nr:hypothetical protein IF1G_10345 [Cordyceps javanica]